jgi:hypothetical protein
MRTVPRRAAATSLALLLVLTSLGTALGAHRCPQHDGAVAAPTGHASDAASGHEHGADPGTEAHGPCTCMGQCQAGTAPPLPAPTFGTDLPAPPAAAHAFRPVPSILRAAIVPFALPWGNAPPTL